MFLLCIRQLPRCGYRTPSSVLPPTEFSSSPTNTPVFPTGSFFLPSFVRFHIFFPTDQVLLSALSWCSACTSGSQGVFLLYPWWDMYSISTYSSTILFSRSFLFLDSLSTSASVLPVNIQGWFPLGLTGLISSQCCPRDSQETSPEPQFESINFSSLRILTSIYDYWKNHRFNYTGLCQQSDVSTF